MIRRYHEDIKQGNPYRKRLAKSHLDAVRCEQ